MAEQIKPKKNDSKPKTNDSKPKTNDSKPKTHDTQTKTHDTQTKKNYSNPKDAPKILGYYSVDGDRNFLPNSSQLLYFNPPKETEIHLDLDQGIESAVLRNEKFVEEGIDLLLEWLKINHKKLRANPAHGRRLQPKFICTRGTLTRILTTRFTPKEGWAIYAAKFKGNIYLCSDKTIESPFAKHPGNDKFSSWGKKFEQYVLSASPDQPPDTSKPVIETAEFRCVYRRRIGNHPVLFSSVMKGLCSDTALKDPLPLGKLKFIETKTNKIIEHGGHDKAFRRNKILRWWAQLYLTDTQEVLCGFRDDSGIVQQLRRYNIKELVAMSKPHWNPKTCIDFCQSFLTTISNTVVNECDETLYKFENIPDQGINITKLSSENQYGFIPESFMEALG